MFIQEDNLLFFSALKMDVSVNLDKSNDGRSSIFDIDTFVLSQILVSKICVVFLYEVLLSESHFVSS